MNKLNSMIICFLLILGHSLIATASVPPYTVLDANEYAHTFKQSRKKVQTILHSLHAYRKQSKDTQIAYIVHQLLDIPYLYSDGSGEGDWQSASSVYKPGATHIQQYPVYRFDGANCQTLVQIIMALLYSNTLAAFDKNYLKIAYGAAGNPNGEIVHYYNRNHFVDADFNPINERNGWLADVTDKGPFALYAKTTVAEITRQNWFIHQQQHLADTVQVLDPKQGPAMVKRFTTTYAHLNFNHFDSEKITMDYIPKEQLVIRQSDGTFKPNVVLLNHIPTPAVVEIVRDIKKWNLYGTAIKEIIGSGLTISHLGVLYKASFHQGDLIYHKTSCGDGPHSQYVCSVLPIFCHKKNCTELMFAHATTAYPNHFFWYQQDNGNEVCSPKRPSGTTYVPCNRVVTLPLFAYLTEFQFGSYWNMDMPSILGIHVEQLR